MDLLQQVIDAIENGDPTIDENILIKMGSRDGVIEAVRLLLEDGRADPTVDDSYPIREAYDNDEREIFRLLLEDGRSDPTVYDNYIIENSAEEGKTEIFRLLLEDGRADPRVENDSPLGAASDEGHTEVVMLLLEWYADHNVPIHEFINLLQEGYRKYILMYYDLNEIPLDTYDFKLEDEDEKFVDSMLASLAYNDEKRERFIALINPIGYNLSNIGIPLRGVRNMISEYAGSYPERSRSSAITQTLDDIGIPRAALIGSLTLDTNYIIERIIT